MAKSGIVQRRLREQRREANMRIVFKTSFDKGHLHTWKLNGVFTSSVNGHIHRIGADKKIALMADGHRHRLLR